MIWKTSAAALALLCASACQQAQPRVPAQRRADSAHAVQTTPEDRSSAAAVAVLQRFADALNARRFRQADALLGPNAPSRTQLDRQFARYTSLKIAVGEPGEQEGAAGSTYLSVPLTMTGMLDGKQVEHSAAGILRRVNDVPGSTEVQRRWRIERIDFEDASDAG